MGIDDLSYRFHSWISVSIPKDALIQAFRSVREHVVHVSLTLVQGEVRSATQ